MFHTIREAGVYLVTAEVKIRLARLAHWPAAYPLVEIEQAGLIGHFRAGFCRNQPARRSRGDRCLLVARTLAEEASGTNRDDPR